MSNQPDEMQLAWDRWTRQRGGDLSLILEQENSVQYGAKLRQTPYMVTIRPADFSKPFLLIPANPSRMSFTICNQTLATKASFYEFFVSFNAPPFAGLGLPVPPTGKQRIVQPINGQISVDDIYVSVTNAFSVPDSVHVLGYEGVLAVEAKQAA